MVAVEGSARESRRSHVLAAIVHEYIATGQPVGSATLVIRHRLGVSPATVRNDMNALEADGFIMQPHTSAGRVPTDLGYRRFVSFAGVSARVAPGVRKLVADFFEAADPEVPALLAATSRLLSDVTAHVAVVVGPLPRERVLRGAYMVPLGETAALAVLVVDTGQLESRRVELRSGTGSSELEAASKFLSDIVSGKTIEDGLEHAREGIQRHGYPAMVLLVREVADAFAAESHAEPPVFLGGAYRTAGRGAFDDPERIHAVLEVLEERKALSSLFREALGGASPGLLIGSENPFVELSDCSFVAADVRAAGKAAGSVGIVGPTRMKYQSVIGGVSEVSRRLSEYFEAISSGAAASA